MRPKDFTITEVFNNTSVGFTFEFYSSMNPKFMAEYLGKATGKAVVLSEDETSIPTWSSAILLKEYNGKRPRYQFKLASQDFMSIGQGLHGTLNWINENAALDYSTKLSVDLSFKNRDMNTLTSISNMDIGKMILKMDENLLYGKFPEMKGSPFALSIKKMIPFEGFSVSKGSISTLSQTFKMPVNEFYGIDFTNQKYGSLKFNYIGGADYASNINDINESIRYYIISTYQVLNSVGYTNEMQHEFEKLTENYSKIRRAYFEPEFFIKEYKDIKIGMDLKRSDQIIKSYWNKLRDPLLKLVMESDLNKGYFNWDSELGIFELKGAKLSGVKVSYINLLNCEVEGVLEHCNIWNTKVKNSRLSKSILLGGNNVKTSLLESCRADKSNTIEKSYIINKGEIINCKIHESIIKNAGIGQNAKMDENCTVIDTSQKRPAVKDQSVKVPEHRDYKWIKSLRVNEPASGYGNEFKIKY